jgi:ABC-type sugar transport system permease subunit
MKRGSTIFLQVVIVLIGIGVLAFLLWEPHLEGRNVNATLFEIYFKDPFLAYAYIGSIPFFVALYQAFKLLGYIRRNEIFSQRSVRALRTIKYCALAIIGFVAVSVIFMIFGDRDDRPAGVFMRILITFPSIVVAIAAAVFERILQNAVDIKFENDLTV